MQPASHAVSYLILFDIVTDEKLFLTNEVYFIISWKSSTPIKDKVLFRLMIVLYYGFGPIFDYYTYLIS